MPEHPPTASGLVSVVVASYNHAGYLARRMQSLIDQTYPAIEILAIDDHSPDRSVEVLRQYEGNPRVRVLLRESNGGWVTVSNQGFSLTSGEFVLFANCDDDCDPRLVARLVEALRQAPTAGVAFCRSLLVNSEGQAHGDDFMVRAKDFRDRCLTDTVLSGHEMRRFLMHSCVIPNLSAALFRRSCLDSIGLFSPGYRACSDWDLFFRIVDHCDVAYVAEPLNYFRQHATTIRSATKGRVTYDEFCRVLLGELHRSPFTAVERMRFRQHVMYLWAIDLLRPSMAGVANVPFHVRRILQLDPAALPWLPIALARRVLELPLKTARRLVAARTQAGAGRG